MSRKKYESAAEKQAAYRQRRRDKADAIWKQRQKVLELAERISGSTQNLQPAITLLETIIKNDEPVCRPLYEQIGPGEGWIYEDAIADDENGIPRYNPLLHRILRATELPDEAGYKGNEHYVPPPPLGKIKTFAQAINLLPLDADVYLNYPTDPEGEVIAELDSDGRLTIKGNEVQ